MKQIRIDYQQRATPPAVRPPGGEARQHSIRCPWHPGVHMVLAGPNPAWNTIRYLCPLCSAAGRPMLEVATGIVSAYWPERGYGFIESGGPRIFFHVRDLAGQFVPFAGMAVTCLVEQNEKGLIGRQVRAR